MKSDDGTERALRDALADRGAPPPCPGEEAMVAFHGGRLSEPENEAIREHLARCAACVAVSADARRFVDAMGETNAPGMSRSRSQRWLAAAAAITLAALAGIWLARIRPASSAPTLPQAAAPAPSDSWRAFPIAAAAYRPEAEDELIYRSDGPTEEGFAEAMLPYSRADYAEAQSRLDAFLQSHPGDARASFYRGVSLLMLGGPEEARPLLAAAAQSPSGPKGARWYLALAELKAGDSAAALSDLDAVAAAPGPHREEAANLAEEIRKSLESPAR